MSRFCTNCGKEIADGIAFCTECGTPAPAEKPKLPDEKMPEKTPSAGGGAPMREPPEVTPMQQTYQPQPQPAYQPPQQQTYQSQPQQTYQQPVYAPPAVMQDANPKGGRYGVVGTGAFFGLMLLFAIPVVGWIACIVMAFASKNENIKHFARAMLIWLIIAAVLCAAMYFLFAWLGNILKDYISEATGGQFGDWKDLFEQFQNGDFSSLPDISDIPME